MLTFCGRQNLNVHYRSRDESLIRFSNHEFYDDRLVTFPAPGHDDAGIRHELVPSPDHDGEELSSSAEVARVTDLVFDHAERRPHESLGIIAMGIRHANRIAAAIDERRKERRDVDAFFARDDVDRAFFVKNLERVQGDERDAIIVSLGYAKDRTGRLKNKLGPLNYAGGERRLNVAVTRSKTRMLVTSTFTEDDMAAGSFAAPGARALCRFVEYARSGGKRLSDVAPSDIAMNPFERDIYETLTAQGLTLVPQLGVSSYRLDFAVLHPTVPNRYVLAIECDGASYHSSATARDRDRLRQAHLEAMGWRFHRIWSLDWFEERAQEIARAREAYAVALAADEARRSAPTMPPAPTLLETAGDAMHGAGRSAAARGRRPAIPHGGTINEYSDEHIAAILTWIASDGILRDDEELLREAVPALGFARRGRIINERLQQCIAKWRRAENRRLSS
jgi:very-short-patch-repair endonuclease